MSTDLAMGSGTVRNPLLADMTFWVVNILNGLSLAMILFLLASGLTLAFGLMRIVNMVHGSFYLLGGYVAFWFWGGNPVMPPQPAFFSGTVHLFGIPYPLYRLFLIGIGLLLALLLWLLLESTKIGAAIRAGLDDEEMLRGIGVNVPLLFACVFALGAGLAALGGVLGGPLLGVFPGADFEVVLLAFVVVTVGGLGSIQGAFWASLLVGLADNFGNAWFPQLSLFTIFLPMVLVLAVRPTGLMGRA